VKLSSRALDHVRPAKQQLRYDFGLGHFPATIWHRDAAKRTLADWNEEASVAAFGCALNGYSAEFGQGVCPRFFPLRFA
jgi:hypothetical protein